MSENKVHITTIDKNYVPSTEQLKEVEALFADIVEYCEYDGVEVYDHLKLVGSDFETITCPNCDIEYDRFADDIAELFAEKLLVNNPETEEIILPCCNKPIKVSNLLLDEDGAFTRFHYFALEPAGSSEYWDKEIFEDEENEEEYLEEKLYLENDEEDPMYYGTKLNKATLDTIADTLGSRVRVFWERV